MCQRQTSCIYIHSNCTLTACPWIPEGRGCGGSAPAPLCHPSLVMMQGNYNFVSLYSLSYFVSGKEDFTLGLSSSMVDEPVLSFITGVPLLSFSETFPPKGARGQWLSSLPGNIFTYLKLGIACASQFEYVFPVGKCVPNLNICSQFGYICNQIKYVPYLNIQKFIQL